MATVKEVRKLLLDVRGQMIDIYWRGRRNPHPLRGPWDDLMAAVRAELPYVFCAHELGQELRELGELGGRIHQKYAELYVKLFARRNCAKSKSPCSTEVDVYYTTSGITAILCSRHIKGVRHVMCLKGHYMSREYYDDVYNPMVDRQIKATIAQIKRRAARRSH